ncbi:MAG: aspartyl-tRNA(Asn)/glutamyl-tRNA(Gln) amidotransferase subunit [Solirubrobacteraceae bacterium]|jgi:aspartyl-tRNA(Asn)/glutamyl-tRNA(Gln) amidotransferase subunit A|nr:aspartyl-tRNA(Asn)/glutamyl-tRNA(Gln) amidotransferase subunit [Solirubrobacteraceae bacterium]
MSTSVSHPADLSVTESGALLAAGDLSAAELVDACLGRIAERDGPHSLDGSPDAINAWIRVYDEDARAAAEDADERLAAARRGSADQPSALCGIPVGLKDLYAVAGRPLTGSSRACDLVPETDSTVWLRLGDAGMVLLGHLHTHEWAAGGSTDQVGNPWDTTRTAGGSSGGSAAALAARTVPAATGSDTAGSLRIPSALCGTSTMKPTRGLIPLDGVLPLAWSLDHPGPMARTLRDCEAMFHAMLGRPPAPGALAAPEPSLHGVRLAVSPRLPGVAVDDEVLRSFDAAVDAARALGATIVDAPAPGGDVEVAERFFAILGTDMLAYHRRHDAVRAQYRASTQELLAFTEAHPMSVEEYGQAQLLRLEWTARWEQWFREHRVDAVLEPTVVFTAPARGRGYDRFIIPDPFTLLTYYWDWTGFPVASLPAGLGDESGLPVGVSVIGAGHTDLRTLGIGMTLQEALPPPVAPINGP